MRQRLRNLLRKELLQLRRDRRMMQMLIIAPLLQLFIFGYAVTLDIKHIAMVVADGDRSAKSRELVGSFLRSGYFDLHGRVDSPADMDRPIEAGQAMVGLHIPGDFSKRLARREPARVQIVVDGTDMNSAGVAAGYAAALIAHYAAAGEPGGGLPRPLEHHPRIWYNPGLRSMNYMVPAVICMILGTVMTAVTAMAVVRERETGTLEQLIVTPIRPAELMLAKILPFAGIGMLDVALVILLAHFWFGVQLAGSLALLLAASAIFLLTTLGLGLYISTTSRTQQQAMLTAFFVIMPSVILSGFLFPVENMPQVIQWVTYLIPLRYFVEIVRGIFLQGSGVATLWPQLAALAALGGAIFALSAARFQKRLG